MPVSDGTKDMKDVAQGPLAEETTKARRSVGESAGEQFGLRQIQHRALLSLGVTVGVFVVYAVAQPFIPALSVSPAVGTRAAYTVVFFAIAWTLERLERAVWATALFFLATLVVRVAIQWVVGNGMVGTDGWHTQEVLLDYSYPVCLLAAAVVEMSLKRKRH